MSTWTWFAVGVGAAYLMVSWWYLAGRIAWGQAVSYQRELDGDDIGWGLFAGAIVAPVGIFVIPILMIRDRSDGDISGFFTRHLYRPAYRREVEE